MDCSRILFVLVIGLLFLGVPVAIALGLSSVLVIAFFSNDSMSSVALQLFTASQNYTLLAIPFFILASAFMSTGGVARRIIRFAIATVGHFRGGLAMAGVLACMLFAALSGSSPATVVAIGTIAIAGMRQVGYSQGIRRRHHRQCRHARHPHPALDRHGRLFGGNGCFGRAHVPGRRHSRHRRGTDADDRDLLHGARQEPAGANRGKGFGEISMAARRPAGGCS